MINTLFVEQLSTIDFSYLCPDRGLVGETWLVDVSLSGQLNDEGMVFDFGHVKKQIKAMIDNFVDHTLLVPELSDAVEVTEFDGANHLARITLANGAIISCRAPAQAVHCITTAAITPESVTPILEAHILPELPENVTDISLRLYPETITDAFYHYSHGLKKHKGDCQRIAHGHRSRIQVMLNNQRNMAEEEKIAQQFADIYLATTEDLIDELIINEQRHYQFSYEADQGFFELVLPAEHCYLMDTDTTVELIASHLAQQIKAEHPKASVNVIAYEGFKKGSAASV